MDDREKLAGAAGLHLAGGAALLRPEDQVFEAMPEGRRNQQPARRLAFPAIEARLRTVRAFADHVQALPWHWRPQLIDEYF